MGRGQTVPVSSAVSTQAQHFLGKSSETVGRLCLPDECSLVCLGVVHV